jgi:hypothetical protein
MDGEVCQQAADRHLAQPVGDTDKATHGSAIIDITLECSDSIVYCCNIPQSRLSARRMQRQSSTGITRYGCVPAISTTAP